MKTREDAIQIIEGLYPTDSGYPETNAIGIELLEQAERNISDWRDLPIETLFEYARLCEVREAE
ncbi:MAG TPA: hypothetical protein ENH82_18515 [bacterium]|nr:hypothetical protein [bacterium]